jgi:hypothetical protein
MYKIGVEFHSDKSDLKKDLYLLKMHLLISNKTFSKVILNDNEVEYTTTRETTYKDAIDSHHGKGKMSSVAFINLKRFQMEEEEKSDDWSRYLLNFDLNLSRASNILECEAIRQKKEFHMKLIKMNQYKNKKEKIFKRNNFQRRKSSPITNADFVSNVLFKNPNMNLPRSKSISSNLDKFSSIQKSTSIDMFTRLFLIQFTIYYYNHFVVNDISKVKEILHDMYDKKIIEYEEFSNSRFDFLSVSKSTKRDGIYY